MSSNDLNDDGLPASPLLRLPLEVRLIIYEYLLFPMKRPSTGNGISVANLLPDFHTYYSEDTNDDPFTLSVRTIDPWIGKGSKSWRRRSTYYVRTGTFPPSSPTQPTPSKKSTTNFHIHRSLPNLLLTNHLPRPPLPLHSPPPPHGPLPPITQPPNPRRSQQNPLLDLQILLPHHHRSTRPLPQRPDAYCAPERASSQPHQKGTPLHQGV